MLTRLKNRRKTGNVTFITEGGVGKMLSIAGTIGSIAKDIEEG